MTINIQRIDNTLPLPNYQTDGSAGFDLYARMNVTVEPKAIALIPSNLIIETPADHVLILALRSSTPKRKGLISPHGIGVIDSDFRGPADEILIQVYNISDYPVQVQRGERIAQGIISPIVKADFVEKDLANNVSRGGLGSTGA